MVKHTEIFKRYSLFFVSLILIGIGIAFTKHAGLGVSPVSSVANVISIKFTALSFGTWTIASNLFFVVAQILILRCKFKLFQFVQIPLAFLIGTFTDLGLMIASLFSNEAYWQKLVLLPIGNFILALGVVCSVKANVLLNSPEAFVKTVAETLGKEFSSAKLCFDIVWVLIAIILSLSFFGKPEGVREGTLISAIMVGFFVKLINRLNRKGG